MEKTVFVKCEYNERFCDFGSRICPVVDWNDADLVCHNHLPVGDENQWCFRCVYRNKEIAREVSNYEFCGGSGTRDFSDGYVIVGRTKIPLDNIDFLSVDYGDGEEVIIEPERHKFVDDEEDY